MSDEAMWRLYDSNKKMFFNNLNLGQVLNILNTLSASEMKMWYVCRDDENNWFPLAQKKEELVQLLNKRPAGVTSLAGFVDDILATKTSLTGKTRAVKNDKRKNKRKREVLKALIDVGDTILAASTRDLSIMAIRFNEKFPTRYKGRFYPVILKANPSITLRGTPLIGEKEHLRGEWNIFNLDPSFNLPLLAKYLGDEVINAAMANAVTK